MDDETLYKINGDLLEIAGMCDMASQKFLGGNRSRAEALVSQALRKLEKLKLNMEKR